MTPRYAICAGGTRDGKRYPLTRLARPGTEFTWDGTTYVVVRQIVRTNAGPMWMATAA
jgi:hypothetical protein